MNLDELEDRIGLLFEEKRLRDRVEIYQKELGDIMRLFVERSFGNRRRYFEICALTEKDAPWEFVLLGGQWGSEDPNDDFDARRGGNAHDVLLFVRLWLLEATDWDALPIR